MAAGNGWNSTGGYFDLTHDDDFDINDRIDSSTDEEMESSFGGFQCSLGGVENNIGSTSNTTNSGFGGFQCSLGGVGNNIGSTSNTTYSGFGGFQCSLGGVGNNIGSTSNTTYSGFGNNIGSTNNTTDSDTGFGGFAWSLGGEATNLGGTDLTDKGMSKLTVADVLALKFSSEAEAEIWYNLYGKTMGFSIRKDNLKLNKQGLVRSRRWNCSKSGFRQQHHLQREDRQREARPLTRVGCKATLRIKLGKDESEFVVADFVKEHNHNLAAPPCVPFLRSHRKVKSPDKAQVSSMRSVGIKPSKIMDYMVNQSGGFQNVGFTQTDLYNYVDVARREEVTNGDAEAALAYLCALKDKDPTFFYKYDVDDDGCLSKLFWSDGKSQLDYARFGDVLVFDTTYRTNAYRKPFVILVGVNNHWQTTIFACALLADEKVETYIWVLQTFTDLMKGKTPISVVTDGDKAMRRAIQEILPLSHHRLCQWHVQRNAVTNIHIQGFASRFNHCMTSRCSPEEFETKWVELLNDFQLHNNRWMLDMYEMRSIWAEAYLKEHFFADMTTTQRCEGINSFIKYFVKSKMRLYEFVRMYEKALIRLRNNEAKAHNESDQTNPVFITPLRSFERQAAEIYTRAMFFKVRVEILEEAKHFVADRVAGLGYINYYLAEWNRPTVRFNVFYFPVHTRFQCSCMLFEGIGIPCRHMIAVMKVEQMLEFPNSCIIQRWLKMDNSYMESSCDDNQDAATQNARYGGLMFSCKEMSYYASHTKQGWTELRGTIARATIRMKDLWTNRNKVQSCKRAHGVHDPKVAETKGTNPAQNNKQSARKCSKCGLYGHTRPRCPKLQPRQSTADHAQERQRPSTQRETTQMHPPSEFQFDLNSTNVQSNDSFSNVSEMRRDYEYNHNVQ